MYSIYQQWNCHETHVTMYPSESFEKCFVDLMQEPVHLLLAYLKEYGHYIVLMLIYVCFLVQKTVFSFKEFLK